MRYKKITKANILSRVNAVLETLPENYVFVIDYRKSLGPGNVNIGQTKTELNIKVFDTDLEDWTHQPNVYHCTFEDSDGTTWWNSQFADFERKIERLWEAKNGTEVADREETDRK